MRIFNKLVPIFVLLAFAGNALAQPSTPPRVMRGATGGSAGASGYVPTPAAGDQGKFLRGDATWQTIAGGGDLLAANNLSDLTNAGTARTNLGLAIGTNVQAYDADLTLWAGITPGTNVGTALAVAVGSVGSFTVYGGVGNFSTLTSSGIVTASGAQVNTANALGAFAIDVAKFLNTKTVATEQTFTFSGTPATASTFFGLFVTNSDSASHVLTIPSSFSLSRNGAITTVTIPASGKLMLTWHYDGSVYNLYGDPVATTGTGSFLLSAGTAAIASGKTATVSNTITFTATDGSTLAIGTGGTLGTGAYQPQTVLSGTANQVAVSNSGVGATTVSLVSSAALPGSPTVAGTASTAAGGVATIDGVQTFTGKSNDFGATLASDDTYRGEVITGLNNSGGVTQWDVVYLNSSSQWVKADANGSSTYPAVGIATATVSTGGATTVLIRGVFRDDGGTSWTIGSNVYLSTTAGAMTSSAPASTGDKVQVVGTALAAHTVYVHVASDYGTAP